jgi:hypothetical protein
VQTGLNAWSLLTYTFSNGTAKIYRNGTLLASAAQTAPQNVLRTLCYIGKSNWAGDPYANATFDDFRLYNRLLSETEIRSLALEQPDAANLVAMPAAICPNTASAIKIIATQPGVIYQLQNAANSANIGGAQAGNGDTVSIATGNLSANTMFQVVATSQNGGCQVILSPVTVNVIVLSSPPVTTGASRCGPGSVTLTASGAPTGAVYYWYTSAVGGTQVFVGPSYTTPSLNATTTWYVSIYVNGCESTRAAVTATINQATAPAVDLYAGLIAYYKFDGNTADSSGRNNHATLNWNGAYVNDHNGQPSKALAPVTGAYVDCGNAGDFQALTTQVTMSIWINETPGNWGFNVPLMNKWQNNGLYMGLDNYYDINAGQQMNRVRWRINGATAVNSSTNVPFSTWTNITCTYDGARLKIYQDGVLTADMPYVGVITNTITHMEIGRQANGLGATEFQGAFDESRIYNRALNADEVMALYFDGSVAFSNTPLCDGETLVLSSPGITGATYQWNGPNGFSSSQQNPPLIPNAGPAVAGTYTLMISNPNNGCVSAPQLNTVIVNPLPAAPLTVNDTVCANGNAVLTASGASGGSYAWYTVPTGGTPISGQSGATYTINNLAATDTFYVAVVSAAGCESPARTAVIAYYMNPIATNQAVTGSTVCASSSTATVTVPNSQPGVSYRAMLNSNPVSAVVSGTGGTITLLVNTAALATGPNTITVQATQASCGSANLSTNATVVLNALPSAAVGVSGATTFCTGGSVTLTAQPGLSYLWSDGTTVQSITVSASGNYSVTVTDANGCTNASSSTTVNVIAPPVAGISASGPLTFCQGGNVTLNASGGTGYTWSTGNTSSSLNVTASGNYYVIASNGSCTDTSAVISVVVNPAPVATINASGPTSFCTGGNVTLTASAGSNYLWSDGSTGSSLNVTQSGNYSVTVFNANGCSATSSAVAVTVNAVPAATISASGPLTFCQGDNVVLTGGGGTSYTWSESSTGSTLNVSQAGVYYVIASNGVCSDTSATVTVMVNALPNVTFSMPADSFCFNSQTIMLTSGLPAGGVYSGPGISGNQFNAMMAGLGNVTIDYTYTDGNGCAATASDVVLIDICSGIEVNAAPVSVSAVPNPTTGELSVIWPGDVKTLEVFDASGRIVMSENVSGKSSTGISLSGLAAGIYQLRLTGEEVHYLKVVKQ